MEVDDPPSVSQSPDAETSHEGGSQLKRSNSAPMINKLVASAKNSDVGRTSLKTAFASRLRRFSSNSRLGPTSPSSGQRGLPSPKSTDRINWIRHEENRIRDREAAHEKEVHHSWQVTHSWDHLSLSETNSAPTGNSSPTSTSHTHRPRSFSESLHVMTSPSLLCGSPSPTRPVKQCFSPSLRIAVKDTVYGAISSPTRNGFMRSLSPIATQSPSLKRRLESDGGERCDYLTPSKKFCLAPSTPERRLSHPLAYSVSSSGIIDSDDSSSGSSPPQAYHSPPRVTPATLVHPHPHPHPHPHSHPTSVSPALTNELPASAFLVAPGRDTDMAGAGSSDLTVSVCSAALPDLRTQRVEEQAAVQSSGFAPIHPDRS